MKIPVSSFFLLVISRESHNVVREREPGINFDKGEVDKKRARRCFHHMAPSDLKISILFSPLGLVSFLQSF